MAAISAPGSAEDRPVARAAPSRLGRAFERASPVPTGNLGEAPNVSLVAPNDLRDFLWREHRIITVSINHAEFKGIRVSPSVYTSISELDRFVDVMDHVARKGLPA